MPKICAARDLRNNRHPDVKNEDTSVSISTKKRLASGSDCGEVHSVKYSG